jgi:hypothetical protein
VGTPEGSRPCCIHTVGGGCVLCGPCRELVRQSGPAAPRPAQPSLTIRSGAPCRAAPSRAAPHTSHTRVAHKPSQATSHPHSECARHVCPAFHAADKPWTTPGCPEWYHPANGVAMRCRLIDTTAATKGISTKGIAGPPLHAAGPPTRLTSTPVSTAGGAAISRGRATMIACTAPRPPVALVCFTHGSQ